MGRTLGVLQAGGIALVGALMVTSSAWAGGYTFPENGPEAIGRGGANVVNVDNASALYFNPANLALLEGFAFYIGSNFINLHADFTRDGLNRNIIPDPDTGELSTAFGERYNEPYEKVSWACEEAALCTPLGFVAPMLFAGYGADDWGMGLGVYGPPGLGAAEYPEDGPQRFGLMRQELALMWLAAGGAYDFGSVRVGGAFMMGKLDILYRMMLDASVVPMASDTAARNYRGESSDDYSQGFDVPLQLEASAWAPAGLLAVVYEAAPSLSFALTVQTFSTFDASGNMAVEFAGTSIPASLATLSDDSVELEVHQPWIVKLGGAWSYLRDERELFDIELNVIYESWSLNEELRVHVPGGFGDPSQGPVTPIGSIALRKDWKDVVSVRLGSDIHPTPWWTARVGTFVESGAVPVETSNLDVFSYNRLGVGVGSTFETPWGVSVALGYEHIFQAEREVTGSEVRATIPLSTCVEPYTDATVCGEPGTAPGDPVGNGVIHATFDIFSVSLLGEF